MLDEFKKIILEIAELNDNDGYDEEIDELVCRMYELLLLMSNEEIKELLNKPYICSYKDLIKEFLINHNKWEE